MILPEFPLVITYDEITLFGVSASASEHVNCKTVVPIPEVSAILALYSELEQVGS